MKIFQSTQNALKMLGIYRAQTFHQSNRLNVKNLSVLMLFGLFFIATILYLIFDAKTFIEYSQSMYGFAVGLALLTLFITIIWKSPQIFQLIDNYENTIARRKYAIFDSQAHNMRCLIVMHFKSIGMEKSAPSKVMYEKMNEKIEKWTSAVNIVFVNVTPYFLTLICVAAVLRTYRKRDLQRADFCLPFYFWLASISSSNLTDFSTYYYIISRHLSTYFLFKFFHTKGYRTTGKHFHTAIWVQPPLKLCTACIVWQWSRFYYESSSDRSWHLQHLSKTFSIWCKPSIKNGWPTAIGLNWPETFMKLFNFMPNLISLVRLKPIKPSSINSQFWILFRLAGDFANLYEFIFAVNFLWSLMTICSQLLMLRMVILKHFG